MPALNRVRVRGARGIVVGAARERAAAVARGMSSGGGVAFGGSGKLPRRPRWEIDLVERSSGCGADRARGP